MTDRYFRSTDGSNADSGATWALAKADIAGANAIAVAGDSVFGSQVTAEAIAGNIDLNFAGTYALPIRVICGNDAAEPPTSVATTGLCSTTGAGGTFITLNATGVVQYYGYTFKVGVGSASGACALVTCSSSGYTYLDHCALQMSSSSGGALIQFGQTSNSYTELYNTNMDFGATGQNLSVTGGIHWNGGTFFGISGIQPTTLFIDGSIGTFIIENVDFSAGSASMNLVNSTRNNTNWIFKKCKLPASWSGQLNSGTPGVGSTSQLINCASDTKNYRYQRKTQFGLLVDEATIVRSGGATDGVTPISWKVVTSSSAVQFPLDAFTTGPIAFWNSAVGSPITATVEFVHDSVTALTDAEIYGRVYYLGSSAAPLGSMLTDAKADVLATAAAQASSAATWTTTGLTNPNKQKTSVTFTPQMVGWYAMDVCICKASYTVYIDRQIS